MAIIKQLVWQCTDCGHSDTVDEFDHDYEEMLDGDDCPNCARIVAEAI